MVALCSTSASDSLLSQFYHPIGAKLDGTMIKPEGSAVSIAKVVEVNASSNRSFEDAIQSGIAKVTETIHNVQGAWINEQNVVIQNNQIVEYRVNLKVTFLVE